MKTLGVLLLAGALAAAAPPQRKPERAKGRPASGVAGFVPSPVLLDGKPFPSVPPFTPKLPAPRRTLFVSQAKENGDGTEKHPFNDLQAALCTLSPGDQLHIGPGTYTGSFRIDGECRDGDEESPIQLAFDSKATVQGKGDEAVVSVRKSHWHIEGLFVDLGESPSAGITVDSPAHHVAFDRVRVSKGSGPAFRIGADTHHVTISNSRIAKERLKQAGPESFGVVIEAGAQDVTLVNNYLHHNPRGSIRVRKSAGEKKARNLTFLGNTIHEDGEGGIDVEEAEGVRVSNNTLYDLPGRDGTRGLRLEAVRDATVQWNRISDYAVALQVGRADPKDHSFSATENVTIDHNLFESVRSRGVAVDIEAGHGVRLGNNVVNRCAQAFLLFGKPRQTQDVTVANNLVLGVSDVAFVLEDPKAVSLFDYNVFSPSGRSVDVEVGKKTLELAGFLKKGTMPHTWFVPGVVILNGDLARVSGVETVDRGRAIEGISFKGSAPDIGVAEK